MNEPPAATASAAEGRRSAWWRFALLLAVMAAALLTLRFSPLADWLTHDRLLAALDAFREHPAAPLVFFAVFTLACAFGSPIVPLVVAGGAAFGVLQGAALSLAAVIAATAVTWFLVRGLGYDLVTELLGDRLRRVERLVARRGFWSLVRLRFVPIPFFVTNAAVTLVGVPLATLLITTTIAMVPVLLAWSAFASALVETAEGARAVAVRNLVVILLVLLALSFLPPRLVAWRRARRLEALRARRSERAAPP